MKLKFLPQNQVCQFNRGQTILEIALENSIATDHSCGGTGSCTTCLVAITKNHNLLAPRNEIEQERAAERNFEPHERLACQTLAVSELEIVIRSSSTELL